MGGNASPEQMIRKDEEALGSRIISRKTFDRLKEIGYLGIAQSKGTAKRSNSTATIESTGAPKVAVRVIDSPEFDESRIPDKARGWAARYSGAETPSLWLSGGSRAGKTVTACWIMMQLIRKQAATFEDIRFAAVSDLVREIWMGSSFYGDGNKWRSVKPFTKCELLVLDDLGTCVQQGKDECAVVREIADKRWASLLPTIYTTQYGLNEYLAKLRRAGADEHDTASLANRILASMSNYLSQSEEAIRAHFVPMGD